ncbi:MAG: Gfo/Idh/MocA family oxidoreductase [Phycisphaerales bacterium]
MSDRSDIGVGVIGLGFMGQTHLRAYRAAGARLVAVCDSSDERLSGRVEASGNMGDTEPETLFDPRKLNATPDLDAMLATPGLDAVSVCTPTDTHVAVATRALRAGKHVLVEKPVALTTEDVRALADAARDAGRMCMPAMCMRFWPAWAWVKDAIDDGRYGRVLAARFERLGAPPTWGQSFYSDESRSGGAMFDLHVHDTDFVVHAFGMPESVTSVGSPRHLTTIYRLADGPSQVVAQGGWLSSPAWAFRMGLIVEFERAVADFQLGRDPELSVHLDDGSTIAPPLPDESGWEGEVRAFLDAIARGASEPPVTLGQAENVTRVLIAERASLQNGGDARV